MINHPLLPGLDFSKLELIDDHKKWLQVWRQKADMKIENGDISTSLCLQTAMIELALDGEFQHDWPEILESYLTDAQNKPLAYSEIYGQRLYKFTNQWKQSPIHAIYTHFWLYSFYRTKTAIANQLSDILANLHQSNGWFYNPQISPTRLVTRMKSEYFMSMLLAVDILKHSNIHESIYRDKSIAVLVSHPNTNYLSSECFRIQTLLRLNANNQINFQLETVLQACKTEQGYCDFSVEDKRDDYMGTRKRTERDFTVHSAISTLQAHMLSQYVSTSISDKIIKQTQVFARHILENPFDIRAFQIRDLDIPFGIDITPLELFSASWLIQINH